MSHTPRCSLQHDGGTSLSKVRRNPQANSAALPHKRRPGCVAGSTGDPKIVPSPCSRWDSKAYKAAAKRPRRVNSAQCNNRPAAAAGRGAHPRRWWWGVSGPAAAAATHPARRQQQRHPGKGGRVRSCGVPGRKGGWCQPLAGQRSGAASCTGSAKNRARSGSCDGPLKCCIKTWWQRPVPSPRRERPTYSSARAHSSPHTSLCVQCQSSGAPLPGPTVAQEPTGSPSRGPHPGGGGGGGGRSQQGKADRQAGWHAGMQEQPGLHAAQAHLNAHTQSCACPAECCCCECAVGKGGTGAARRHLLCP